jgi:hypothetical protein
MVRWFNGLGAGECCLTLGAPEMDAGVIEGFAALLPPDHLKERASGHLRALWSPPTHLAEPTPVGPAPPIHSHLTIKR